jgi:hypothetical protein
MIMQGSELRESPRCPGAIPVITEAGKGITRDFSGSGVFFETNGSFSPGQSIEFSFVLEHLYPDRPVCLKCKGAIVRVEKNGLKIGVAATIDSYTIEDHHP